jgi:hypothetical protein
VLPHVLRVWVYRDDDICFAIPISPVATRDALWSKLQWTGRRHQRFKQEWKGERAEICGSGHWHANAVHGVARLSANQIRRPRPACGPLLSSSGKLRRTRWLLGRAAPRPSESHAPVVYNSSSRPGSRLGPAFLLERSDIFF